MKNNENKDSKQTIGFVMNYSAIHRKLESHSDLVYGWELIIYDYSMYLMKRGYKVFWLLYSDKLMTFSPKIDGIQLIRLTKNQDSHNPVEGIRVSFELIHVVKKNHITVVYTRATFLAFFGSFACKVIGVPFIFHIEDLDSSLIKDFGNSKMVYPVAILELFYQKNAALLARKIVTVSKAFKGYLVTNWSIQSSKIDVLYEGVEVVAHKESPRIFSSKNGSSILYVGGGTAYDGIDVLIRAFALISKKLPNSKLIIGTFSRKNSGLKQLCQDLNISSQVEFFDSMTGEKARYLAKDSDIAVIPRRRTLSTQLTTTSVVFLYISENIPVIAPRLKAISELMNGDAVYFEPENVGSLAESIFYLESNIQLQKKISARLVYLSDLYSRDKMCDRLYNVIKVLISK